MKQTNYNDTGVLSSNNNTGYIQSASRQNARVDSETRSHSQPRIQNASYGRPQDINQATGMGGGTFSQPTPVYQAQDGAAKSTMRLQLGNLKRKAKELEDQVREKDLEIAKIKDKVSDKAQDGLKEELKRAYDVLRHLKKKVG